MIRENKGIKRLLIFILCFVLTGCGPQWKRKFVRKRAEHKPEQVFVYEPREYQKASNSELYKKGFLFWKAWQEELVNKLGDNKANDLRVFIEVLKNLDEMKNCLNDEKAKELDGYARRLEALYKEYKSGDFSVTQSRQMRQDLDRLMLKMDKVFRYSRVKEFIK